jgi:pimeloyl-ACP methyl ester carboxylesterase
MVTFKKPFEQAGYTVFSFDYASTQEAIPKAAANLHKVIDSLEGIEEINFVVHSMGGLVVRAYIAECAGKPDKRIKRMVMIGVPNRGAALADMLNQNKLFQTIFGPAGQQLVSDPEGLIAKLPVPEFEFAIIAGGKGTLKGYNPLVPGDDDGTVSVNSTRLEGAADFILLGGIHSFLMRQKPVIEATIRFIRDGKLRESGEMRPIPRKEGE